MTTKERIADEALTLFSTKGYKGTSVKNIAAAVGIRDSSLYKHFRSKKDIFDTIVKEMQNRMSGLSFQVGLPLGQDRVSRFWKMAMMEQYHSPEIYAVYHRIFIEESITYQTNLFREMIRQGYFYSADPEVMATSFYSPIFFLLVKYMGEPEEEDAALTLLDKQVTEFYRIYRNYG